ncbi:hypothetical protein NliqN6_5860 [Naganishia liquefaciens]|uniref:Sugar phosphate transporter domain-containing protein n=1 Tax=Naganishia liquefaciens TaxID=104408 RepID=A0A8H3TYM1_9TREE|nr:hypothetical protein NliqN6_5860 [Naganishia liquefaciens]
MPHKAKTSLNVTDLLANKSPAAMPPVEESVSTLDFSGRRSPSPLSHRSPTKQGEGSSSPLPSPTQNGFAIPYTSAEPTRKDSEEPYAVGTPVDYFPANGGSSGDYESGEMSPQTAFTPLTRTLQEKRQMMGLAAQQEDVSEDPLAKLGYKPLSAPDTPGSRYNFDLARVQAMATAQVNRRDSNLEKVPLTESTGYWLALYFAFNLGLTLYNKVVLVNFPFPYTLTGFHALSGCVGCYIALERGAFTPARLTSRENLIMAAFSVLYTINIAVSNLSLQLVTVPFHQVVRASTPLFTILISSIFFKGKFTLIKLVSLLPVIAGVGFATYGDYYFTAWGLILTLLGTFLAALKTVITNVIQTGGGGRLKLHPLDLLMRMSPLAFVQCVVYGLMSGELKRVQRYGALEMTRGKATALLLNGVIAFGLNIVSFTANKKAGPLTMTVAANCKQVLTIAIAVVMFNLSINFTNGIGIILTLIGGAWYGWLEYVERNAKARPSAKLTNPNGSA